MALNPELLKRRKRIRMPRAPPRTLGAKTGAPLEADEKLEKLLEDLLAEAKSETLFTLTLEKHRLFSALTYAGFMGSFFYNCEIQVGPGATVTVYLPVMPGWVLSPVQLTHYSSLPWWLTVGVWTDSDVPALPIIALTRAPDYYEYKAEGISAVRRFMRFTVTNNHATDTGNYLALQLFGVIPIAVWKMLEEIYLKPVVVYAQEKAEELTGRPFP